MSSRVDVRTRVANCEFGSWNKNCFPQTANMTVSKDMMHNRTGACETHRVSYMSCGTNVPGTRIVAGLVLLADV